VTPEEQARFQATIDTVVAEFRAEISGVYAKLDAREDRVTSRLDKLISYREEDVAIRAMMEGRIVANEKAANRLEIEADAARTKLESHDGAINRVYGAIGVLALVAVALQIVNALKDVGP